jgi:hypothetical protein
MNYSIEVSADDVEEFAALTQNSITEKGMQLPAEVSINTDDSARKITRGSKYRLLPMLLYSQRAVCLSDSRCYKSEQSLEKMLSIFGAFSLETLEANCLWENNRIGIECQFAVVMPLSSGEEQEEILPGPWNGHIPYLPKSTTYQKEANSYVLQATYNPEMEREHCSALRTAPSQLPYTTIILQLEVPKCNSPT